MHSEKSGAVTTITTTTASVMDITKHTGIVVISVAQMVLVMWLCSCMACNIACNRPHAQAGAGAGAGRGDLHWVVWIHSLTMLVSIVVRITNQTST